MVLSDWGPLLINGVRPARQVILYSRVYTVSKLLLRAIAWLVHRCFPITEYFFLFYF